MQNDDSNSIRVPFSANIFRERLPAEVLAYRFLDHGPSAPSRGRQRKTEDHLEMLAREFSGQSLLAFRHACLVVEIRREGASTGALTEFREIWDQHARLLAKHLDLRWLVSAADTFLCHPRDAAEAEAALTATLAANIAKLYETERLSLSITGSAKPGPDASDPLFDGMTAFKVGRGDMLANLVGRVRENQAQGPAAFLARVVLERLFAADTVLRRITRAHDKPETRPAFRPKTVALFNDTAGNHHYGCQGVMHALDTMLREANASVIYRHHVGEDWQNSRRAKAAMQRADLVLVNGEGSIHHGSKRARDLAAIGRFCRTNGIRSALVNATVEANDATVMSDIAQFDHVWVRESASSAELGAAGIANTICPDLTLTLPERSIDPGPRKGHLIVDSVVPEACSTLARIAIREDQPLLVMKRHWLRGQIQGVKIEDLPQVVETPRRIKRLAKGLHRCSTHEDFRALVAGARGLTTGRFHAACYAVLERTPFSAIGSNTSKIETLIADIGLIKERLFHDAMAWQCPRPFSRDEFTAIENYLRKARAARDRMSFELFGW